jgi:hypothetical protein
LQRQAVPGTARPARQGEAAGHRAAGRQRLDRLPQLGRPHAAIERLNRLRELLFAEPASLGAHKLPLTRLSSSPKFRSYAENAHWVVGKVLYATVNLPANNNHYLAEAGRNSEFEDRLVANRFWLNRLFALAKREEARCDRAVFGRRHEGAGRADRAARLLLTRGRRAGRVRGAAPPGAALAQKFAGKVLLVDTAPCRRRASRPSSGAATWARVSVGAVAVEVKVTPGAAALVHAEGTRARRRQRRRRRRRQ